MTDNLIAIKSPVLCWALIAVVAGILASASWTTASRAEFFFAGLALLSAAACPLFLLAMTRRFLSLAPLASFCCLLAFGFGSTALRHRLFLHIPEAPQADQAARVLVAGRIAGPADSSAYSVRFTLEARAVYLPGGWHPWHGLVQVSTPSLPGKSAEGVIVRGILTQPAPARNPGGFDERRYLAARGINHILQADTLVAFAIEPSLSMRFLAILQSTRATIANAIHTHIDSPEARAILTALVIGDRSAIEFTTMEDFRKTGLLHVLAVSGLHVLLVGISVYHLLHPVLIRTGLHWRAATWIRCGITMGVLLTYMAIAGGRASVVRAVVMAGLGICAPLFQRPFFPLHAMTVAALLLLLLRPSALFDAGFQLSFAAVTAIFLLRKPILAAAPGAVTGIRGIRSIFENLAVSLAATAGTLPVLLYHFGEASFAGLLLNIVAIPLTTLSLCAGLLMLAAAPCFPPAADLLGESAGALIESLLGIAAYGADLLGGFSLQLPPFSPWLYALLLGSMLLLAIAPHHRRPWSLLAVVFAVWAGGIGMVSTTSSRTLEAIFFDIGHGDAALVTLPNHRRILIDAGNMTPYAAPARRVLLPFLRRYGITEIDAFIATHPHADHYAGLEALLPQIRVRRILTNGVPSADGRLERILADASAAGSQIGTVQAGDTLALDASVRIEILSPSRELIDIRTPNESSIILSIRFGATSMLFMGDAERTAESLLEARFGPLLDADVVKVGHHGSRTSSNEAFIERILDERGVRADWAVISTGRPAVYGLPDEEVLARWQRAAAHTHVTAESGALWLVSDGQTFSPNSWR